MINEAFRPDHLRWDEFMDRLAGPDGCDVHEGRWTCFGDHRACRRILEEMGATEAVIDDATRFFRQKGGYCDCEVLMNVPEAAPRR